MREPRTEMWVIKTGLAGVKTGLTGVKSGLAGVKTESLRGAGEGCGRGRMGVARRK